MMGTKRRNVSLRSDAEDTAGNWHKQRQAMMGTKRRNVSLRSDAEDTAQAPSLDSKKAVSSQQHVRALNTQFASWVQCQLENHPDELWEDGVQDYLTHASNILEQFSDVVTWLKASTANGGILPSTKAAAAVPLEKPHDKVTNSISENSMFSAENKFALPSNSPVLSNTENSAQSKPSLLLWTSGVTTQNHSPSSNANASSERASDITKDCCPTLPPSTTLSAPGPPAPAAWSFGLSSSSQTSFNFGSQSTGPSNEGVATAINEDADDCKLENEEQPSSPSVIKSEEKGYTVVHETKCKLYVKSSDPADKDPWKDKGTGQLSIKCKEGVSKGAKESKPTILVRNDVGRILLNALLYPGIKTTSVKSSSILAIFHTAVPVEDGINGNNSEVVARTFLIKTKNGEERKKLAEAIRENALQPDAET